MKLDENNPRKTTFPHKIDFDTDAKSALLTPSQHQLYISSIGDLRYITDSTHCDISFVLGQLASFKHNPTQARLQLLQHTIRYLSHTKSHGLNFKSNNFDPLRSFTDSDYVQSSYLRFTSGAIHLQYV